MDGKIRIAIVGDLFPRKPLAVRGPVALSVARLRQADIAFGNLEAAVSRRGAPVEKLINLRTDPERLADLRQMGFNIMSVANNHTLDYGLDAFQDTLSLLRESKIMPVGGGQNLEQSWAPVIQKVEGIRVAFLAAACTLPPGFAAARGRPGVAPIRISETLEVVPTASMEQPGTAPYVHTRAWAEDVAMAQAAVVRAREAADFLILAIHWGVPPFWRAPFQGDLADYQRPLGQTLIEAGADLLVGHHPHSLQAIEIYQGKPIFYSLGNFVFHAPEVFEGSPELRQAPYKIAGFVDRHWSESIILEVSLKRDNEVDYELWPVLLDDSGDPHLLEGEQAIGVIQRLAQMSSSFGTELVYGENRGKLVE